MKILLLGKDGQVGFALQKKLLPLGEVIGTNTWGVNDPEAGFYNVATSTSAICLLTDC